MDGLADIRECFRDWSTFDALGAFDRPASEGHAGGADPSRSAAAMANRRPVHHASWTIRSTGGSALLEPRGHGDAAVLVRRHVPGFLARLEDSHGLPEFVRDELAGFGVCGTSSRVSCRRRAARAATNCVCPFAVKATVSVRPAWAGGGRRGGAAGRPRAPGGGLPAVSARRGATRQAPACISRVVRGRVRQPVLTAPLVGGSAVAPDGSPAEGSAALVGSAELVTSGSLFSPQAARRHANEKRGSQRVGLSISCTPRTRPRRARR